MSFSIVTILNAIAARLLNEPAEFGNRSKARDILKDFAESQSRPGKWTAIKKPDFCERIEELINSPQLIDQKGSGYCQSVAPLYLWALCYPARFTAFAIGLYETSAGQFGDITIGMQNGLVTGDLNTLNKKWKMDLTDLMLTLALREYQNNFLNIDSIDDSYAYTIGTSMEAEEPIEDTDLFQTDKFRSDVAGFQGLKRDKPSFVIIEGSISAFADASFGYHAAVMRPSITVDGTNVIFQFWSWGMTKSHKAENPSSSGWRTKTLPKIKFEALGEAYHVTPNGNDFGAD